MKITATTRRFLRCRRQARVLTARGYERLNGPLDMTNGVRWRERIVDVVIDEDGKDVWVRTAEQPEKEKAMYDGSKSGGTTALKQPEPKLQIDNALAQATDHVADACRRLTHLADTLCGPQSEAVEKDQAGAPTGLLGRIEGCSDSLNLLASRFHDQLARIERRLGA